MKRRLVSVVVPVYNEADSIVPFYEALDRVLSELPFDSEVIFVDDGSQDNSAKQIASLDQSRLHVKLLRFSRNFGKEAAVTAGLAESAGDAAIVIDADLQHPVDAIPDFIDEWRRGADVVVGVRRTAGDRRWIKRLTSSVFYRLINAVSHHKIIPNETDFRLITREVIDQYNNLSEHNRITRGLIDWLGYDRAVVYFDASERKYGKPKYGYRKLTGLAINSFVSYSFFPLRFAGYLGVGIIMLSSLVGVFVFVESVIMPDPLDLDITGTGVLALITLFMVGVILFCLGLIGLYIASIHDEVAGRPLYVIRREKQNLKSDK